MALKFTIQFPIFAPPKTPTPPHHRPPTEIRFSRWNNANAEPFNLKKRAQQQIEDDIRRHRRFDSAGNIVTIYENSAAGTTTRDTFKSTGTPSSPSRPSIPGKSSKYSKNPYPNPHPAFRKTQRKTKISRNQDVSDQPGKSTVAVSEDGVSFKVEGAPFEMMYSYTETPKVKPIALRETPFSPFGPPTMARPWTGRAPLPASKKKLKEFDSFVLPPPHKKGVKPVQRPGPFLPGSGPKYVKSREEILGEPLTEEEVKALVQSCIKSERQLNMGRDGLTHNMLDNIHAHWKRRRVCKIKCKGVCTVDMANVREQLEEKTGGKIIYGRGGVLFLFRGRNYNYRTRPRFPIMLWKPVTPVYPRLIKQAPEGLTLEEAGIMRKKGRKLIPICKLAKNGVYSDLVKNVREAFEACELVRINCQGLNGSDYRKIGAKLKDLVPCVLISFEHEHLLMWRGRDWKSSFPDQEDNGKEGEEPNTDDATYAAPSLEGQEVSESCVPKISVNHSSIEALNTNTLPMEDVVEEQSKDLPFEGDGQVAAPNVVPNVIKTDGSETILGNIGCVDESESMRNSHGSETILDTMCGSNHVDPAVKLVGSDTMEDKIGSTESFVIDPITSDKLQEVSESLPDISEPTESTTHCTEGVLLLLKQALEHGSAIILDDAPLDDDIVYKRVVAFSQSAPPGPVFRYRPRRVAVQKYEKEDTGDLNVNEVVTIQKWEKEKTGDLKVNEVVTVQKWEKEKTGDIKAKELKTLPEKRTRERKNSRTQKMNDFKVDYPNVAPPRGTLGVDELAKLLG